MDWVAGLLLGIAAVAVLAVVLLARRLARATSGLESQLSEARARMESLAAQKAAAEATAQRVPILEAELKQQSVEASALQSANSRLQTQLEEQSQSHGEKVAALTALRSAIDQDLKVLAADALRINQGDFLALAKQTFETHRVGASADLAAREQAVAALVTPLKESLQRYQTQLDELEKSRSQAYGSLSTQLQSVAEGQNAVRTETSRLVQALRAAPKTRGRWGEQTLRNVLELSGLSEHCDFTTEQTFERDEARLRPDAIIRLPGGRSLVVDAKTSLSAYLDAVDAIDDLERERYLKQHAGQLRQHMKQLAAKNYWDGLTVTPDFVVMFVPGENFYAAAVERDATLFDEAAAQRVVIATPATLIAIAKSVAFGWRQEKVAENARQVHELGRDLYRRLATMSGHIASTGEALEKSVRSYNQFVGSLEQTVMPQARRFNELQVEGTATAIAVLDQIDTEPRRLRTDRDFAAVNAPRNAQED